MSTPFSRRALLGGGLATLTLAACGVSEDAADVELSDKEVTLRFSWWGSDARHELTQQVIDAFQKQNPKIKVKGEFADWVGYWDRVATTFAANDAPDVVQMDQLYLRTYADRNSLLDLGTTKEFLDTGKFDDRTLAAGQVEGKLFGLPTGNGSLSVVTNRKIFEKYGLDLPDDKTWTWDDFAEISAEISKASKGEVVGSGLLGSEMSGLTHYARQHGGALFDESGQVVLKAEHVAPFWEMNVALAGKGAPSAEASAELLTAPLNQTWLVLGKQAFNFNWNTQITSLQAAAPDADFVLLQIPQSADGSSNGFYYKPSMYWSVAARTEHPAEAAKFVDFLANSPEAAKIMGTDRGIPANAETLAAVKPDLDAVGQKAVAFNDQVASLVGEPPALTPAGASDIDALIQRHMQEVLFGRAEALEEAQKFVDELTTGVKNAAS
ncbi:extracellular solute-binding protein [Kineosporia rhizophila]|uniref:ABC transporter substrate-binding protein n=1 Tax=Kineosporia TaxID=49184 RepID=UPI001E559E93|nr:MULTISPECIES: extracellular solute-binding protein [Kineosporia]MCE0540359.1 extracellular solute-binding protein [Kineosporia rhizophila]GLY16611.1 sugar ABC transporter substrate-binding protein [Kineosporia sp. NBRC 101677]